MRQRLSLVTVLFPALLLAGENAGAQPPPQPPAAVSAVNGKTSGAEAPGPTVPPRFDIRTRTAADRVEVEGKDSTAAFTVSSPSGIGAATISLQEGSWPSRVILRLRLKGLESLTISNEKVRLAASVSSHSGNPRRVHLIDNAKEKPVDQGSPSWLEIKIVGGDTVPLKDGYFEMVLPAVLFREHPKTLKIEWIDFYRG